jgi:hypothetical protein
MVMFIEQFGKRYRIDHLKEKSFGASIHKKFKDEKRSPLEGEVFAVITKNGISTPVVLGDNLVVNTAGNLLAQLSRGYTGGNPQVAPALVGISDGPVYGMTHMSVGSVGPLLNPSAPTLSDTSLGAEYFRKAISQSQYVNEIDGTQSALPTRVVDFITSFDIGEAAGSLTEAGLWGGINNAGVGAAAGGGIMFARRTFPVMNIDTETSIAFTWRIYF